MKLIIGCVWFFVLGVAAVMADAPAKAGYIAVGLRSPFKRQFLEQVPLVNPPEKAKDKVRPKEKKITAPPQIAVEGIISGREASYAIIGGKVFRAEDKIGEALITGISKEGVEVLFDAEKLFYPAPSKALAVNREKKDAE